MKLATSKESFWLHMAFIGLLLANASFWYHSRTVLPQWGNVPSAPRIETAALSGLGDSEISYRMTGYFLQNLGNVGGRYEALNAYNYDTLGQWFTVAQSLDARANYVPFLAAYLFGGVQDDSVGKLDAVIDYLASEGQSAYPQKWRWLLQAVYLARFRQKDLDKALKLANILANLDVETAPWARQMPAFVQMEMGNKDAAYEIMVRMLETEQDKLHPNEINAMVIYICTRTLDADEAAKNPLCQSGQ